MKNEIRVLLIASPLKLELYRSIWRFLPEDIKLGVVSAEHAYGGRIPFLRRDIWYIPRRLLLHELIKFRPDIVFTNYPAYPSWFAKFYSFLRQERTPLIAWLLGDPWSEYFAYHAPLRDRPFRPLYLFSWSTGLQLSDRILTICDWLRRITQERYPGKPVSVQYQGVDPKIWMTLEKPYAFKRPAVGILQDHNILPKVQGLLWFSEVVKKMTDVDFYIAGAGIYTHLVHRAYEGHQNVHFVGRLEYPRGVRRFYQSCDLYAHPSGLDCFPATILEASLSSLPIVASRVGGIPEMIVEGKTGWIVPNGETDSWVSRIRKLLGEKKLATRMGANSKQLVLQEFTWKHQAQLLAQIFRNELDA
jgi:glycosyltransferase involved in cell wall biosynthesis